MDDTAKLSTLTDRQVEVCRELLSGKQNDAICRALNMQPSTVKMHMRRIEKRIGLVPEKTPSKKRVKLAIALYNATLAYPLARIAFGIEECK